MQLIRGNAFKKIRELDDGSVQLTVCSPPYNMGREYEKNLNLEDYISPYAQFIQGLYDVTSDTGSVCWQVGSHVRNGQLIPLDYLFYPLFVEAGFQLRNRIVWTFGHGLHSSRRLSGRYETILWFSKSEDYEFNLDEIRVPSKYPGKRAYKGPKKGQISGNPKGKNPSDFWQDVVLNDWEGEIWDIPNVKANHTEKTVHPCQFPVELVQRCVLGLSSPGDLVFDPFMGVGSSAVAALMHDRKFVGIELERGYFSAAIDRIGKFEAGELKVRCLGKPVHQPKATDKVAQIPEEWRSQDLLRSG